MKKLFSKTRFGWYSTLAAILLMLLFNIFLLFMPLAIDGNPNLFTLSLFTNFQVDIAHIFAIGLAFFMGLSLIPLGLTISNIVKKRFSFLITSLVCQVIIPIALFLFAVLFNALSTMMLGLAFFDVLMAVIASILIAITKYYQNEANQEVEEAKPELVKPARGMLISLFAELVGVLLIFCVPFIFSAFENNPNQPHYYLLSGIFSETKDIVNLIFAIVYIFLFSIEVVCLVVTLLSYKSNKLKFYKSAKFFSLLSFLIVLSFFLASYSLYTIRILTGVPSSTLSYIPLAVVSVCAVIFSFFSGQFDVARGVVVQPKKEKGKKFKFSSIEPLFYIIVFTVLTFLVLFVRVIVIKYAYGSDVTSEVSLTGLQLLQQYPALSVGYQILAYFVITVLIISGVLFVANLVAYFAKHPRFNKLMKVSCYFNYITMFLMGISCLYFVIVQDVAAENITSILKLLGVTMTEEISYSMMTDTLFIMLGETVLLCVTLFRFKKMKDIGAEPLLVEGDVNGQGGGSGSGSNLEGDEVSLPEAMPSAEGEALASSGGAVAPGVDEVLNFDPCPAFSLLDSKVEAFDANLAERNALLAQDPSLATLVPFIVNYARNSRLRLSYSKEDIATFVAGLGACRLTILQGMSGTGKTSLPKIFAEAIFGNCEIVEVESSWKDKNELLGYYNEFSNLYTPKSFTRALYKATLNKEVPTFIVLDEMNLSRVEYYFSDFLSLMENEKDKRNINLLNLQISRVVNGEKKPYKSLIDGHILRVPENIWFIGTANRDESTFVISDKVYDRAHTMNFMKRAPKVKDGGEPLPKSFYTVDMLEDMFANAIANDSFDAEQSEIISKVEALVRPYNISFGNRILNQIEAFVSIYKACFPDANVEKDAIEIILLSKVVAKLEVKTIENKDQLVAQFEAIKLHRCAEFIANLNED